jgi:hypothetical protein
MKPEYKTLEEKLIQIFKLKDKQEITIQFKELVPEFRKEYIRFMVFYNKEVYQRRIDILQNDLSKCIAAKDFEYAASKRHFIRFYENKIKAINDMFGTQKHPICIVDKNGLINCHLHIEENALIIELIRAFDFRKI